MRNQTCQHFYPVPGFETGVVMFTSICINGKISVNPSTDIVHISPLNPGDTDNNVSEPVLPPSRQLQIDSSKQLSRTDFSMNHSISDYKQRRNGIMLQGSTNFSTNKLRIIVGTFPGNL